MTIKDSKDSLRNYGFIEPVIQPEEYISLGSSLKCEVINPSKDWTNYLPEVEIQHNRNFDTQACYI